MHILTRQFEGVGFLKFHEGEIPFDCWNRILFAAYSGGVNGYVINRLAGESEKQTWIGDQGKMEATRRPILNIPCCHFTNFEFLFPDAKLKIIIGVLAGVLAIIVVIVIALCVLMHR